MAILRDKPDRHKHTKPNSPQSESRPCGASDGDYIPAPKLRAKVGISAVTLWRWRQDEDFPVPKVIRGRLYFPADAVTAWFAKRPEAKPNP
jgi:predicted DNA-binding transcriptional regulator AlpA